MFNIIYYIIAFKDFTMAHVLTVTIECIQGFDL